MAEIKDLKKISKKWNSRVGISAPEYLDGVKNPKKDWAEEALAAKDNYVQGIQDAIAQGRREKGISDAGTRKWQDGAVKKSTRWTQGVSVAMDAFEKGFSPYSDVIKGLDYGAKYTAGDPRNLDRVKVGNDALHLKKVELKSLR